MVGVYNIVLESGLNITHSLLCGGDERRYKMVDWQDIDENGILNYDLSDTGMMSQFNRIMLKKLQVAYSGDGEQ